MGVGGGGTRGAAGEGVRDGVIGEQGECRGGGGGEQ